MKEQGKKQNHNAGLMEKRLRKFLRSFKNPVGCGPAEKRDSKSLFVLQETLSYKIFTEL